MIRTEDYKRELVSILFAQKHLIFWTTFLIFAGGALIALFSRPIYGSTATVLISAKQLAEKDPAALETGWTKAFEVKKEDIASEIQILTSPEVVSKAMQTLAAKYPALAGGKVVSGVSGTLHETVKRLSTKVVPGSNVIKVEFTHPDPQLAVDLLNAILDEYMAQRGKFFTRRAQPPIQLLADRAERYSDGIRQKEDAMIQLVSDSGVASPREELAHNISLKKDLERQLGTLKNEYVDAKLTGDQIEKTLAGNEVQYFAFLDNQIIKEGGISLTRLYVERGNLLRIYQPESEEVKAVDVQIEDNLRLLKKEAGNIRETHRKRMQVLESQIRNLENLVTEYEDKNVALEEQAVLAERLMREAEVMKSSYSTYSKRHDEVALNEMIGPDDPSVAVKVVNRAFPSGGPVFPKKNVIIPLGLLVGLLTGFSFGFVREYFDHSFKKPSDVAAYAGLPVLFSLSRPDNKLFDTVYSVVIGVLLVGIAIFVAMSYR